MTLKLYFHPLSSFCHKALIALYENGTAYEPVLVDLGDAQSRAAFKAVWPVGKFPVLRDEARGCTVAESTAIIEYLDAYYPGPAPLVPRDPDLAWQARMWDRVFDHYVHHPMQKIVGDTLRPADARDPFGVEQARGQMREACRFADARMTSRRWAIGDEFGMADCAAAPALFYADVLMPLGGEFPQLAAYLDRLMARPSYARALREAEPYFKMFPMDQKPQIARASARA